MDSGLFHDSGAIRRVAREAIVLGGAGYAVLMQVAHPAVARGVHRHSDFGRRPLGRLRGTLGYVYAVIFGTREEAERVSRRVRAAHRPVAGDGYDAADPELQLWVAATLHHAAVTVYQRAIGPLDPADLDEAHRQYAVLGTALGLPEELWPATRADSAAYWESMVATLRVGDEAREIADQLFRPRDVALRPFAAVQRFLTAGLLPPGIRAQYGLTWGPVRELLLRALFGGLRLVWPLLPAAVREFPMRRSLRLLRERSRGRRRRDGERRLVAGARR
ncbi:oxygenase MpaB family protein [Marinactinospora rubrisoli]|uniref:Oxygenase MpaB family protein n=1 Tax=Marinactinospora rubrisoli TaxID=2715399 RepID=A0ABW2KKJ5_9ACTN